VAQNKKIISTTSFGKNAAVMLHMAQAEAPGLPVIWVDTGYNLRDTYVVAERLIKSLDLNMQIFSPQVTSERRNSIMGGIPTIEDIEQHEEFTRQVKLEPFNRAIEELQPEIWLTGIRQQETDHRKSLDIVSIDGRGIVKVAPIFYWDDDQVESYMNEHSLISCRHYFDPTKVHDGRECGLHTSA
ncbi:phosphoadenosine phosphosulfate reductase family protein, partial [Pseudomonadales bacterium]|nr:phosphoadenosine phosphosulfate reductase family protein [Pseudomonadales bacterium]